ncbi:zona pellucida sperm-binding protein 4-like [Anabas testudineus]|uniref:ZP domain-containing protein n=1 Tax=Anabas testudineus TaxID=64144 RepID=A0A3Q1JFY8_ANATE|nr:zona pellucida sperm-binding protein 4-like [Anabas testudineus]
MKCPSAKLSLILLTFTLTAQHCSCFSDVQVKKTPELALPRVTCSARRIKAAFSALVNSNVHVRDTWGGSVPVSQSEESCGVRLSREKDQSLSFYSRYDSCYVQTEGGRVVVPLQVQLIGEEKWFRVNISCPLIKRENERNLPPTPLPGNCDTERALRVDCGNPSISTEACYKLGCCYDARDLTCYYKLNDCSLDGHFVFSVKTTDADVLIDPNSLIIKDHPQCFPVVTTIDTAVFKIGVTDCGAKMKERGDVVIYELEVEELKSRSLTDRSAFSLQVQCEYDAADLKRAADLRPLHEVTNPPLVAALGTIRVQMRIATDESFKSFFAEDQLPLALPLRETAYVEVSIARPTPDPTLSLRVRDCFAYPASRRSVWMLLYDGCPNPSDNMRSSVPVDHRGRATSHSQVRRFDVKTFAFLDPDTGHPSVEEIYFYCWVEICTADDECAQSCTIISSENERQRREATSDSDQLQLVSLGPLMLGQNDTEVDDSPCEKQQKFRMAAYLFSGVGATLLLVLLFTLWPCIKKCRATQEQQVDSEQCE